MLIIWFFLAILNSFITKPSPLQESYNNAKSWVSQLEQSADRNVVIALAGNQCDMEHQRAVNREVSTDGQANNEFSLTQRFILTADGHGICDK